MSTVGSYYSQFKLNMKLKLARLLGTPPNTLFGGVPDEYWFWLHTEGCRTNAALRRYLPGMPDETKQVHFTGSTGETTLQEGFGAYRLFKGIFETHAGPLDASRTVLDFGCGWGRIIRFFLRDVPPANLHGIDCYDEVLELCKQTNRWCNFQLIKPEPPTSFSEDKFDLIYCYSVFSHLSEEMHQRWLKEFQRILKPGGLLIATTWPRDYIENCDEQAKQWPEWMRSPTPTFADVPQYLERYDRGEFCYSGVGGGGPLDGSFFGEACISRAYVLNHWTKHFAFLDYVDDRNRCGQNVIVVKK